MTESDQSEPHTRSAFLPPRWVVRTAWKIHRGLYRWSGGRMGLRLPSGDREGLAQLTTTGRRSGIQREVMIAYFEDGDDYVTMAMNGWSAAEPAWWLNLQTSPHATLTLADGTIEVAASAATGAERDRLWARWRHIDKGVDRYSSRRPAGTAVVVFSIVPS